jgi:uncharacterized protein (TIGR03437 family)
LALSKAATGNVIASPSTISYTYTPGGSTVPGANEFHVTSAAGSGNATSYTISTSVTSPSGGNWLDVSDSPYGTAIPNGTSLTTPSLLYVSVSASGLSAEVYSGTITLTPAGGTVLTIPVTLTVNAPVVPVLTASPSTVSFSYQQGAYPPAAQWIMVNEKDGVEVNYTATASSSPSGWLVVSPSYGSTSTSVEAALASAVVAGLAPGSYSGSIVITPSVAGSVAITIPVTLSVIAAPVTISRSALNFTYGGGSPPASQSIQLSAAGGAAVPFTARSSNSNWFSVAPTSGSTPATLVVTVTPAGLVAGLYEGSLLVTAGVGTATNFIPIALNVSASATISVDIPSLRLSYQIGGSLPPTQSIVAQASGGAAVPFTAATSANWLSVTQASATTLCYLSVSVNPVGLAAGTYNANVILTANIAGNPQTLVPVTLTVTAAPTVTASPASLDFAFRIGGNGPIAQLVQLTASDGSALGFSAAASSSGNWLSVAPGSGTTPAKLAVSASPASLTAGVYAGTATLTASVTANPQTVIPVSLTVTAAPTVSASPTSLSFAYQMGGSLPAAQFVQLTASDSSALSFTAVATSGGNWLLVAPTNGTTPATVAVSIAPTGLAVGTYSGTIVAGSVTIPVSLTISAAPVVSVSPTALSFSYQIGNTVPASQSIQVGVSSGAAVSFAAAASSSGNWLSVAPTSGTAPATVAVSVAPVGIAAGTNAGTITVNGTAVITVSLSVSAAPVVSASPSFLSFTYQTGGSAPASQSIQVSVSGGATVAFAAVASIGGGWLSVAPTSGTTPAALSVSVAPLSLAAGTYSGTITVNGAIDIPVSLTVTFASSASVPVVNAVLNAASYSNASVSPGEMVSIFGTSIGPADPAFLKLDATGNVSSSLTGVTVSFSGYAAPLTYVSATQINAVVPYEIAGASTASVSVTHGGQTSNQPSLQLTAAAPAIFTQNGSGTGAGAILNQDSSLNTQANPAAQGSTIQTYMTGEGLTAPTQATGTVTPVNASGTGPITPAPQQSITVLVGGQPAQVQFAGEAPGDVAGVLQVNALVPSSAGSGAVPIMVRVGNAISQTGVTVWVR